MPIHSSRLQLQPGMIIKLHISPKPELLGRSTLRWRLPSFAIDHWTGGDGVVNLPSTDTQVVEAALNGLACRGSAFKTDCKKHYTPSHL